MARDISMHEFCDITRSEESSIEFARQNNLLLSVQHIPQQVNVHCLMGTAGCNGELREARVFNNNRQKYYNVMRCSGCKKYRSAKNAIVQGQFRGASANNNNAELRSFFATASALRKSQTKISIKASLTIVYLWANKLSLIQSKGLIGDLVLNAGTLVDWRNYVREICFRALNDAPQMGGPGETVQIDESLMRGRRKYNRGRLLLGNRGPGANHNYGNRVVGPWIFGMVWKRPDGKQDLRMFHVLRRNEITLRAIIQRHVAPGTLILSDEWAAYRNIANWPGFNYTHATVNHNLNFIDPITGAHTQRIESHWGHVKTEIVRKMRGTSLNLLPGHLATYWWRGIHPDTPFRDILREIANQFPLM